MRIAIGSDHGGFELKKDIIEYLKKRNYCVVDVGCFNPDDCDYPQYSFAVAGLVGAKKVDRGIAICKSGIGNSIVANKVKGVRAALCFNVAQARSSREHNDANMLVLGALYVKKSTVRSMLCAWLKTSALAGRHARRVRQIKKIETKVFK
ncbi:MAG: ribose 5-phosphate isomerase B [Candidatus Omnitrophica bacterium]|nr:ribose 5-phosphate isomerase B [Candidatus Omnitrophota bacterium]